VRAGLGAVAVVVLLGAGVTMGLPRRALDIWQSIIAQDPGPDSTTPPAADPEAPVGPRRPRPVRPGPSAAADAVPPGSGFVRVFSRIRVDVFLGARRLGSSEDERLLLPSGRHRLRVVNGEFRFEGTVEVEVTAGGLTAQTVKLPTSPLRITAPEGSEISVEGEFKAVAVAPITSVAVEIGTREVLVRHPSRGEKRQSVEVRNGEPAVITIDLDTAPPTGADAVGLPPVMPSGPPASNP
jgi:hypothetical protein